MHSPRTIILWYIADKTANKSTQKYMSNIIVAYILCVCVCFFICIHIHLTAVINLIFVCNYIKIIKLTPCSNNR